MERGGGALYDIGCYAISSSRFLLGREPERVIPPIGRDEIGGTDVVSSAILDFGNVRSLFAVSTRMTFGQRVSIFESVGYFAITQPFPEAKTDFISRESIGPWGVHAKKGGIYGVKADEYNLMLNAFARAFREGAAAPISPADTIANMAVIDAVYRSESSGVWEQVRL